MTRKRPKVIVTRRLPEPVCKPLDVGERVVCLHEVCDYFELRVSHCGQAEGEANRLRGLNDVVLKEAEPTRLVTSKLEGDRCPYRSKAGDGDGLRCEVGDLRNPRAQVVPGQPLATNDV